MKYIPAIYNLLRPAIIALGWCALLYLGAVTCTLIAVQSLDDEARRNLQNVMREMSR